MAKKILVLGGDGYLGWPTAMHFSAKGYEVTVVDNYMRRHMFQEVNAESLFPVPTLPDRVKTWQKSTSRQIKCLLGDLQQWDFVKEVFWNFQPDIVIHFAEQPSAPYSMMSYQKARSTLHNNIGVTLNLIYAIKEFCPDAHIIKLGTMGEYGTPNIDIEEGWLDIKHKGREQRFLYPRQAGSLYHTTKIMDTDLLWFYVRAWGLRVSDLMQGPVYGITTEECVEEQQLWPFFNYDEVFGTVINRFLVQAVAGIPLTVYGKGGQKRGYLNIEDTLQCIRLSIDNPPEAGELQINNQFTEVFSVNELAAMVQQAGNTIGLQVKIKAIENPRLELEDHYYNPSTNNYKSLGLKPHHLTEEVLVTMLQSVNEFKDNIKVDSILPSTKWK